MIAKLTLATVVAAAFVAAGGFNASFAKAGSYAPTLAANSYVGIPPSVLDSQRRCASALNGEQPLEVMGRCGITG